MLQSRETFRISSAAAKGIRHKATYNVVRDSMPLNWWRVRYFSLLLLLSLRMMHGKGGGREKRKRAAASLRAFLL
jgi:hypothetical protein